MSLNYFGNKCPICNTRVDIGVVLEGNEPLCPNCKTVKMVPDKQGNISTGNAFCKLCNVSFGLINSDKCPNCGKPFSSQ